MTHNESAMSVYRIEYGVPIYRGNHRTYGTWSYRSFRDAAQEVEQKRMNFGGKPMLLERVSDDIQMLWHWEEGWIHDELTDSERRHLEIGPVPKEGV